ncbi:kinesin-like protein KIF22 isoform X2 [Carex littledalei]|uniref:Kinesin-like protein KIF22 isoform X2 n=1 Tax=Carex littledalei TaxID=544730 RepID=A0A833QUN0_9POAL|nr:kinesin-like protein KIF22 isoform X2 [Carex littledalei]
MADKQATLDAINRRNAAAPTLARPLYSHVVTNNSTGEVGTTLALLTGTSPKLSDRLREISNSLLKWFPNSEKPAHIGTPKRVSFSSCTVEAKTPNASSCLGLGDSAIADMPQESLVTRTTDMKKSLQKVCLTYINSADKADLKRLKGIGEVRADMILQLRDNNPEPFKDVRKFQIDLGFGIIITELKYHVPSNTRGSG